MPSLAVTQPYIPRRTTDLIDTNTDNSFNNLQSAYAAIAQAQQALIKCQNRPAYGQSGAGEAPAAAMYFTPKNVVPATFKTQVDLALIDLSAALVHLQTILVDANS